MRKEKPVTKESLLRAFKKIDINGDGYITHEELFKMLTMVCTLYGMLWMKLQDHLFCVLLLLFFVVPRSLQSHLGWVKVALEAGCFSSFYSYPYICDIYKSINMFKTSGTINCLYIIEKPSWVCCRIFKPRDYECVTFLKLLHVFCMMGKSCVFNWIWLSQLQ